MVLVDASDTAIQQFKLAYLHDKPYLPLEAFVQLLSIESDGACSSHSTACHILCCNVSQ